jgi:hypothetical protein
VVIIWGYIYIEREINDKEVIIMMLMMMMMMMMLIMMMMTMMIMIMIMMMTLMMMTMTMKPTSMTTYYTRTTMDACARVFDLLYNIINITLHLISI